MANEEYRATLAHLYGLRRFGMRPGLEVIRSLLGALDHPEERFRAIHVTGSKGKGSVSAIAAEILEASGRPTGRFTSPHLKSYRERIQVRRRPISASAVVDGVARVREASDELLRKGAIDRNPTFFEVTTALAFDHFARKGVEHAVIEAGLGGRLDSTNVLRSTVGVVTTIELEHTEILGPTERDIAQEKAGIFHAGIRGIVGELKAPARDALEATARGAGVPLWHLGRQIQVRGRRLEPGGQRLDITTPPGSFDDLGLPLAGSFQAGNAALAIAAALEHARSLGAPITESELRKGLGHVRWRGRLEKLPGRPDLYVDVAHTPESARALALSLGEIAPFEEPQENAIVFGCLDDKRVDPIFEALAPLARTLVAVPVRSARSLDTAALRRIAVGRFPRVVVSPDLPTGFALARAATGPDGFTLVTGSDYLVGELLRNLEGGEDEPDLSDVVTAAASDEVVRPRAPSTAGDR
ncbi:MAG: bifunctional folylpolyglutamate synthase/dihydrofolate synthase [Thermoplasmata archaeon]|nr:bifunctional folylpolyglutamate synthase/dihydrofolate synthase [Thermoplasmata archaeon]